MAIKTMVRVEGLGGVANVDGEDPIVGRVVSDTIVVVKKLGAGGMGSVYLAIDTQEDLHDRKYALKVMPPTVASTDRDRFRREVSAAARVRSRRIVEIHRHGAFRDHRLWILMDYVDGHSLESELERNRGVLGVDQALSRVGLPLVRAVGEIHAKNVIHKDLKPANIMLERAGEDFDVKLLDFGIARIGGGDDSVFKTDPNIGGGSPGYWSPEGISGRGIEYRTDVWSIGVILFEMLSGELPFGRPTSNSGVNAQIAAVMGQPPRSLNEKRRSKNLPPVTQSVESLIEDCLNKDVLNRITLRELHERLKVVVLEQARKSGVPNNPLLTLRSAAQLMDFPTKPQTRAGTADAAAVKDLIGLYSSVSPATSPEAPLARRTSSRSIGMAIVVAMVTMTVAAVVIFCLARRSNTATTIVPMAKVSAPAVVPAAVPSKVPGQAAATASRGSENQLISPTPVAVTPAPVAAPHKHKRSGASASPPVQPAPQQPVHDDNGPVNPF